MLTFWIAAPLIAAGATALIVQRALAASRVPANADPAMAVYRRQLAEIDDLAERGLIPPDERQAARAETGRRLLAAAGDATASPPSKGLSPALALGLAAAAPLLALGLYLMVGSPNLPDQPFARRLAAWRAHPERYAPPELAAALRGVAAERPDDPEPLRRLALLELSLGDADAAIHALRKATAIAPSRTDLLGPLGEILVMKNKGEVDPQAAEIFRRVLTLEPGSAVARYYLARARVTAGDTAGGLADWRVLLADLSPNDPRRPGLEADIASVVATGRPAPPPAEPAPTAEVGSAIRGMVEGLAARLKANPDNPDGWVRLVRAYTVLGETAKRDAALAEARRRYAGDASMQRRLDAALVAAE
jgi:cytochrome c-type biogenesis protein CcmH